MQSDIIVKKIQMKDFYGLTVTLKNVRAIQIFRDFFFLEGIKPYYFSSCKSRVQNLLETLITVIIILKEG